ncbi:MAG: hypothetical protein ACYC64_14825 [Armatimonadota bacterium]
MYTTPLPDNKINQTARERMGDAIYLLAHVIRRVDWKTATLRTTHERISRETGFPLATIKRWIDRLVNVGEITCRRTLNGTIITVNDYDAIARTRGVAKSVQTKSDPNDRSEMDPVQVKNDPNHVIRILSQTKEKNSSLILSSSGSDKELSSTGKVAVTKAEKRCESDAERQERLAREWMEQADEESQKAMIDDALKSMEDDPRPFVRIFVRRNEDGDREFVSHSGDSFLMTRIGVILEERGGGP